MEILENFGDKQWAYDVKNICIKMQQSGKIQADTTSVRKYALSYFNKYGISIPAYPSDITPFIVIESMFLRCRFQLPKYDWFSDDWSFLNWELEGYAENSKFKLIPPKILYK